MTAMSHSSIQNHDSASTLMMQLQHMRLNHNSSANINESNLEVLDLTGTYLFF